MSKTYTMRIPVSVLLPKSDLEKYKNLELDINFTLLEILPKSEMCNKLKRELVEQNFVETKNGLLNLKLGKNVNVSLDLQTLKAKVGLNKKFADIQTFYLEDINVSKLEDEISQALENNTLIEHFVVQRFRNNIEGELVQELLDAVKQAKQIINKALNKIYKEAIKEKAESLGEIMNISETEQNGVHRIKIELKA